MMKDPRGRITGERLKELYKLPIEQALYHKDGVFYEVLSRFPGALCDGDGYVPFETEEQFLNDSRLKIGKKVNAPNGVFRHPRYMRFPRPVEPGQFPQVQQRPVVRRRKDLPPAVEL